MSRGSELVRCARCGIRHIAWSKPRVEFCYACLPGGPFRPPPCRRCGSPDYYSGGLCRSCHHLGRLPEIRSCLDCCAWGTIRRFGWLCLGCRSWRARFSAGPCLSCGRRVAVNELSAGRLCWSQAAAMYATGDQASVIAANRHGQQLGFASHNRLPQWRHEPARPATPALPCADRGPGPLAQQLTLFDMTWDMRAGKRAGFREPADPALAACLMNAVASHAERFGWTRKTAGRCRTGIRIILGLHDAPGLMIRASDVQALYQLDLPVRAILDVCDEAGVLDEDRLPAIVPWFEDKIAGLPEPMTAEQRTWFRVMRGGSGTPPRRRPRSDITIRVHLRFALPALQTGPGKDTSPCARSPATRSAPSCRPQAARVPRSVPGCGRSSPSSKPRS